MIVLNNIGLNSDATSMQVSITVPTGETFATGKLWTSDTFQSATDFVDLASVLPAGPQATTSLFDIPVSLIGETTFNGVFFIEFTTVEETTTLFAISNLTIYDTCILDKVLQTDVIDCVPTVTTDCGDLSSSQLTFINTLLESLEYALLQSDNSAAQAIELQLQKLCTDDCGCTQTENALYITGTYITDDEVISGIYTIVV